MTKVFNEAKYTKVSEIWQAALSSESAGAPFAGNLEDPMYLAIIQGLRDFKPELYVPAEGNGSE